MWRAGRPKKGSRNMAPDYILDFVRVQRDFWNDEYYWYLKNRVETPTHQIQESRKREDVRRRVGAAAGRCRLMIDAAWCRVS